MKNDPKPDDRRDNVDRIQNNIDNTIANYRETKDLIKNVENSKDRQDLIAKNQRREQAVKGMREEIRDEAIDKKNGYK
ncbi:MAG: small acid-soluble spore protein Tlp [Sedimentibacter sp.]|uniref:small acid-soluble spore protein Tlp n=1 Tax=Sedimentibacter sp. TaxID=1960295 RepID=UPI0031582384